MVAIFRATVCRVFFIYYSQRDVAVKLVTHGSLDRVDKHFFQYDSRTNELWYSHIYLLALRSHSRYV